MKSPAFHQLLLPVTALACSAAAASAQTVVFSESFDPAPADQVLSTANIQLGGSTKPSTAKYVTLGQWGFNPVGSVINIGGNNGNALQPRSAVTQNGRSVGIFLAPSLFAATGAGTYTLSFDVIPSATGVGRVYVGAGSGYDLSQTTDAKLNLQLSSDGFGVRKADGSIVWSALTASGGATASHLITTRVEWIDSTDTPTGQFRDVPGAPFDVRSAASLSVNFEYDGSSTLVVAFGGYETDYKVDNLSIATAIPDDNRWAGFAPGPDGYVDTGAFLGWIFPLESSGFVWSQQFGKFIYLPEELVTESGAWTFIPRQ
jgi:hypothetical protein